MTTIIRYLETSLPIPINGRPKTIGKINIGTMEEPNLVRGVEYEFVDTPTAQQLAMLDLILHPYKREGGRNMADVITDSIDITYPNPQKEAYKLSQLYGLTQAQLETYIDSNVTNLAEAKVFLKKLSAVVLWLVKQTKLDQ